MIWGELSYIASEIPESTTVGQMCHIDRDVHIGKNCKIQGMVYIPPLTYIGDDVFIGPGTVFTNDRNPLSDDLRGVTVGRNAVIGAGSRLLAGIVIGENSKIGMGSVVTKDVPSNEYWWGVPARKHD